MTILHDNHPRFASAGDKGHVESWFLRLNDPASPRAAWLKATVLRRPDQDDLAESWLALFHPNAQAARRSVPLAQARFSPTAQGADVHIGGDTLTLQDGGGSAKGSNAMGAWDVRWRRVDSPLGDGLCPLPSRTLIDAAFPKNKLLTPSPALRFEGTVTPAGRPSWSVDGWIGMQGHNWGAAHAPRYAWGQCVFPDANGEPGVMVEGFAGRLRVAGRESPTISALIVRRGEERYRFDRLVDLWRQHSVRDDLTWRLRMRGRHGDATLQMSARPDHTACLAYENPDGSTSYCLNSKVAATHLRVDPVHGAPFTCESAHGGALEFLQPNPDPRLPEPA